MSEAMTDSPYSALVIDHFDQPRNVWDDVPSDVRDVEVDDDGLRHVSGEGGRVDRGVWIRFHCEVSHREVRQARFRAYGCPHTIALASWLTDRLVGETLAGGYTLDRDEIGQALDLPTEKLRIVLIAEDAIRACAQQLNVKDA